MKRILFSIFLCAPICLVAQVKGTVIGVTDGDTFVLLAEDSQKIKVRFAGIDCPEFSQPYGYLATKFTGEKTLNTKVEIIGDKFDHYGRLIGTVILSNGKNLNEMLLSNGLAWHYKKYDQNPAWADLEEKAKQSKVGLWKNDNPVAPWDYRRAKKK